MAKRIGNTVITDSKPRFLSCAAAVGKKESEGPLAQEFDLIFRDTTLGEDSWEKAESALFEATINKAIEKSGLSKDEIQAVCAGDLLNQCISSAFSMRSIGLPFCGLYGACSTMALGLCAATLMIESGGFDKVMAATGSHFCTAERQFRMPLEYAGQRTPTAQWTVTGSGAAIIGRGGENLPYIDAIHIGRVVDLGVTDMTNMGAAMAPAAAQTLCDFFRDTGTQPKDYDAIFTGDLGFIGSDLLCDLMKKQGRDISEVHDDCGKMIYYREEQDVHGGGSGCGCCASVLCSNILRRLREGELRNVLFLATGALMSVTSSQQGESIPSIAHLVSIKGGKI